MLAQPGLPDFRLDRPNDRCHGPVKLLSQCGSELKVVPSGAGGWLTIQSDPRFGKNAAEGCGQAISPLRLSRAFFTAALCCSYPKEAGWLMVSGRLTL